MNKGGGMGESMRMGCAGQDTAAAIYEVVLQVCDEGEEGGKYSHWWNVY